MSLCICAVCYILSRGVFALVTVTNRSLPLSVLNAHLLTFNMPLVTTDPTPTSPEDLDVTRFTLRVWPHVDNAVGDIIIYYRWQQFFFLYDFDDGKSFIIIKHFSDKCLINFTITIFKCLIHIITAF